MGNLWAVIAAAFCFVVGLGLAGIIVVVERCRKENTIFSADDARNMLKQWTRRDIAQMNKIERKIKRCCRRGEGDLILTKTPSARVVESLKNNGFKVDSGLRLGILIKWKE